MTDSLESPIDRMIAALARAAVDEYLTLEGARDQGDDGECTYHPDLPATNEAA